MYLAFLLAGFIDLMSYFTALPAGLDQVQLLLQAWSFERQHVPWSTMPSCTLAATDAELLAAADSLHSTHSNQRAISLFHLH